MKGHRADDEWVVEPVTAQGPKSSVFSHASGIRPDKGPSTLPLLAMITDRVAP